MSKIFIIGRDAQMISVTEVVSRIKRDEFSFNSF